MNPYTAGFIGETIHADKILDSSKERPRVVYYYGSFNPPHLGHLNAVEEAIKQTKADFAVVVADDRANSWKEFKTAASFRTKCLELLFKDKSHILVANSSHDHVRDVLLKSAYTILLIGSDVFPRYYKDKIVGGSCRYPEVVVSFREGDLIDIPKAVDNVSIHSFTQTKQGISSTKVREIFYAHPEWYDSKSAGDQLSMLPTSLVSFILEQGIYSEKSQRRLELMIKGIKAHFNEETVICPIGSGLSGNFVFAVCNKSKTPIAIVKVFQKNSYKEDLDNELKAASFLESHSWNWIKNAEVKWFSLQESYALLCQSYMEGLDMGAFWKTLSLSKEAEEELKRQAFCIGRSIRELHQMTKAKMDLNLLEQHLTKLEKIVLSEPSEEFYRLRENYLRNPGGMSCVHGDANPGNFFVGDDGTVTWIDLGDLALKGGCDKGHGFPGYEYTQFISSLTWFCKAHHISPSMVNACEESFKKGYGDEEMLFSASALTFYQFYWKIRS